MDQVTLNGRDQTAWSTLKGDYSMSKRYQARCLYLEKWKAGPDTWVFRFRAGVLDRKEKVGTVEQLKTKLAARKACEFASR
jgi:hypothetical protein